MFHIPCRRTIGVLLGYLVFIRERGTESAGRLLTRSPEGPGTQLGELELSLLSRCMRNGVCVLHSAWAACNLYVFILWCYKFIPC